MTKVAPLGEFAVKSGVTVNAVVVLVKINRSTPAIAPLVCIK
jgi:hypothetical protein